MFIYTNNYFHETMIRASLLNSSGIFVLLAENDPIVRKTTAFKESWGWSVELNGLTLGNPQS